LWNRVGSKETLSSRPTDDDRPSTVDRRPSRVAIIRRLSSVHDQSAKTIIAHPQRLTQTPDRVQ
jgi:hypothetical protein